MKKIFCIVMFFCVLMLCGCNQVISFTCEKPLEQTDFRLFFSGLSTDIMEMPIDGELQGKDFPDIEDKFVPFYLVYKGNLVYYNVLFLRNRNASFNLCLKLHPSQLSEIAVLEITYKNKRYAEESYHQYVVVNVTKDESMELPPESHVAAEWENIKENILPLNRSK